ncbi:J domain-containing protein [Halocola ammonii]
MVNKYFEILGVGKNATLAEIKKAFRKKAKQLHPDVNDAPDAKEQFILLNEAYDYFQNLKAGKAYSSKKHTYRRPRSRAKTYEDWKNKERERTRERAREHARMEYEAFLKTDYYKTTSALATLVDYLATLFVLFIFIGVPIIGYSYDGKFGLIMAGLIVFVTVPVWARIVVQTIPKLNFREFVPALTRIVNSKSFFLTAAVAVNFIVILKIGFNTLIPVYQLVALLGISFVACFLLSRKFASKYRKQQFRIALAPSLVSFILVVNFVFATGAFEETYSFRHRTEWYGNHRGSSARLEKVAFIHLQQNKYEEYEGIRLFFDFESMKEAKIITYTFADGLLGWRVVKDYEFEY